MTVSEFTPAVYQLEIPGMDGFKVEKCQLSLGGSVDKTSREDVDAINAMKLGDTVELRVTAFVTRKGYSLGEGANGLGYGVGLKVQAIEVA